MKMLNISCIKNDGLSTNILSEHMSSTYFPTFLNLTPESTVSTANKDTRDFFTSDVGQAIVLMNIP